MSAEHIASSSLARTHRPLRRIGAGHCGSVWANPDLAGDPNSYCGPVVVVKRADGGPGRSLSNDHAAHRRLLARLQGLPRCIGQESRVNFPLDPTWISSDDEDAWQLLLPNLPVSYTACDGLVSEQISPMPRTSRQLLVDRYCPPPIRGDILKDERNIDCLIRPYLGRRRTARHANLNSRFAAFSLRNLPLHADQMEELGLDLNRYARAMAEALAYMHWRVNIDAGDVEFVLAPDRHISIQGERPDSGHGRLGAGQAFTQGQLEEHAIWILDFDCCKPMTLDKAGVDLAVRAFYRNDPFYPRPGRSDDADQEAWAAFRVQYIETSRTLLDGRSMEVEDLPELFVEELVLRVDDFKGNRH